MKILHLPLNVPGSEQIGQARGFAEIFDYDVFDYLSLTGQFGNHQVNEMLLAKVADMQPDIIWAQLQETNILTPETFATIRQNWPHIWLTTWSGDARVTVPPYLASVLPHFDIFYNCTDQQTLYEPYCRRYEFMPIAVDPYEVQTYLPMSNVPEIVFIGNHYGMDAFPNSRSRYELMKLLSMQYGNRFGVYGAGWPHGEVNLLNVCAVKEQGSIYNQAKVVVSMDHFNDMCYWSERRLWALASETPVVIESHPKIEDYFYDDVECLIFNDHGKAITSIEEALQSGKDYINHAKKKILREHTWTSRAQQVLDDYKNFYKER